MTTKEQERKALEQIRKIVAGLGEDSYVATAFEGCFEIAEQNIENDFACSMEQRADRAEANLFILKHDFEMLNKKCDELNKDIENLKTLNGILVDKCDKLEIEKREAEEWAIDERKDLTIETTDGETECKPFSKIEFHNNNGFRFVNVVEKSGWVNSYKIDDLKVFEIR